MRREAAGAPEILNVLVGRFPRDPPLYFEMRRDRVLAEIAQKPDNLALYDDLAVAFDRLGDPDSAIDWMQRKAEAMKRANSEDSTQQYRYLANLGTFYAHRWLKRGADPDDMTDLDRAIANISQAIASNPDAHFGREAVQLEALQWIVRWLPDTSADAEDIPFIGQNRFHSGGASMQREAAKLAEDLAGLITLGAAWQSVDIHRALVSALMWRDDNYLAYLGLLRAQELVESGQKSLLGDRFTLEDVRPQRTHVRSPRSLDRFFQKARAKADEWQAHRTQFMLAKLQTGMHPDTHADFWAGYTEIGPLRPPLRWNAAINHLLRLVPVGLMAVCVIVITLRFLRRYRMRVLKDAGL